MLISEDLKSVYFIHIEDNQENEVKEIFSNEKIHFVVMAASTK